MSSRVVELCEERSSDMAGCSDSQPGGGSGSKFTARPFQLLRLVGSHRHSFKLHLLSLTASCPVGRVLTLRSLDHEPSLLTLRPCLCSSGAAPSVKVCYFASVRTTIGQSNESFTLPNTPYPLSSLIALIAQTHFDKQVESKLKGCRWSVNNTLIEIEDIEEWALKGGEEVAAIPPVSGG